MGCSQHKPIITDQEYLKMGHEYLADEDYRAAVKAFEDLEANYPDSPYVAQARLEQANTYFAQNRFGEAALQYQRFLRYHPRNPLADKARYKLGLSYFKQRLTIDRDPSFTKQAFNEFSRFIQQYSQSPLAAEAREKQTICLEELAEHDFYIGNFYFKRKGYEAAINRLRQTFLNYPQTKVAPEALFYLAESHWQLNKNPEARQLFKLYLKKYPDHEYASQAKKRIKRQDS